MWLWCLLFHRKYRREAAELQRQKAEALDWLEAHPEVEYGILQDPTTLKRGWHVWVDTHTGVRYLAGDVLGSGYSTLLEAIQSARAKEGQ